jgi:FdhD protein
METFKVIKVKDTNIEEVNDVVAREVLFTLTVGDKELVTLACSPHDLEDLARGFLFTSGLIQGVSDIKKVTIDDERWNVFVELASPLQTEEMIFKRLYTSGCGRGTLFYSPLDIIYRSKIISDFTVDTAKISSLTAEFGRSSQTYLHTGGTHSAAIANNQGIVVFREDIGRHNAIDKVIGHMVAEGNSFSDTILITSGRISSEIIFKVRRSNIAIIVSKSAPTNQAVRHAQSMDITLIGFARGKRMNIYSAEKRIRI